MSTSSTYTSSNTFTEARARTVMGKVQSDFINIANRGFITEAQALKWAADILFCMNKEAVEKFDVQFSLPGGSKKGIRYAVKDDGTVAEDARTGGIDYWSLPDGTTVDVVLRPREGKLDSILPELQARGWGQNGKLMDGEGTRDVSYSKEGYAVQRTKLGDW